MQFGIEQNCGFPVQYCRCQNDKISGGVEYGEHLKVEESAADLVAPDQRLTTNVQRRCIKDARNFFSMETT